MAIVEQSLPTAVPPFSAARTIKLIGLTLALGYLIVLGGTFLKGDFLLDAGGRPIANDFVDVYAAGRLAAWWVRIVITSRRISCNLSLS